MPARIINSISDILFYYAHYAAYNAHGTFLGEEQKKKNSCIYKKLNEKTFYLPDNKNCIKINVSLFNTIRYRCKS